MIRPPPTSTLFPTRRSSDLFQRARATIEKQGRANPTARFGKESRAAILPDRKSTRLNSSHPSISYAVFCLKKKKKNNNRGRYGNHIVSKPHSRINEHVWR